MRILVATGNRNKLGELRDLLEPMDHEVVAPADVGGIPDVVEDRDSFEGNAEKKAIAGARATGMWTLADDSGLEVDHLGGAPGVRSARFSGEGATAEQNNALLLEKLAGLPPEARGARFVCVLVLARPDGGIAANFRGTVEGRILEEARGSAGFGYDPLFLFTEGGFDCTGRGFAELSRAQKSVVSHRGRALRALIARLPTLLDAPA